MSMFRDFVYRFGLVGVAGRYLLLWRLGLGWSRTGLLSLFLLPCLPALWLGLPLLDLRVVCRSCFGVGLNRAQRYGLFEHKWPLVGFSAACLAAVANEAQSLSYGIVDGKQPSILE